MKIRNDKIKITLALGLLIFLIILFVSPITQKNIGTIFLKWTSTPESLYDVFPVCREVVLEVLEGDTLDSISLNYAIPKKNIMKYNRLKTDEVFPGMVLLIQLCRNRPMPTVTPVK